MKIQEKKLFLNFCWMSEWMKKVSTAKQSFKVIRKWGMMSANFKWAKDKNIHICIQIKWIYGKILTLGSYQQGPSLQREGWSSKGSEWSRWHGTSQVQLQTCVFTHPGDCLKTEQWFFPEMLEYPPTYTSICTQTDFSLISSNWWSYHCISRKKSPGRQGHAHGVF